MEELGNIAVFLAGWNSEYQTRLINGIIRKAKEANYAISFSNISLTSQIRSVSFSAVRIRYPISST